MRAPQAFSLFQTPVIVFPFDGADELNNELREKLLAESQVSPGIQRSNAGGWHSRPDIAQRTEPCFLGVMDLILHHVHVAFHEVARSNGADVDIPFRYAAHGWAMIMRDGDYTIVHDHAEAHWSTVYYVDAGDADLEAHPASGQIAFVDPRRGPGNVAGVSLYPSTFTVRPKSGMLIVFPGWLQHYVHPYRGARPRISISCNVVVELTPPAP